MHGSQVFSQVKQFTAADARIAVGLPFRITTISFGHHQGTELLAAQQDGAADGTKLSLANGGLSIPPHAHEYFELSLVHNGKARHCTEYFEVDVVAGSVVIIPPGMAHAYEEVSNLELTNVQYLGDWLIDDLRLVLAEGAPAPVFLVKELRESLPSEWIPNFSISESEMAACRRELDDIIKEVDAANPSILFIRSSFHKLLLRLSRAFVRQHVGHPAPPLEPSVWAALGKVEECIQQCVPFRVAQFAKELGLSPDTLRRGFERTLGHGPGEYYQRRRVQYARRMLIETPLSVTDIAHTLGYCDTAHFCHFFERYEGVSPNTYRGRFRTSQ